MRLNELKPAKGSRRPRTRVGRGPGSGLGKTAGKGEKGQKARSGGTKGPGFEGGQMPLQRRIPKRGFHNRFREPFAVLNLKDLADLGGSEPITPEVLRARGLLKGKGKRIKILGEGEIRRPLVVHAHGFSKSAQEKILAAGGRVEVIARA